MAQSMYNSQDSIKDILKIDLREDLEKYNGFYTAVESTDGKIPIDKIPERIKNIKDKPITNTSIQYLQGIKNGYILTYRIQFGQYKLLVISTLDKDYLTKDFVTYTDGTGAELVKDDTITMTYFGNDYVELEIMHPNKYNEPLFSVDGIRKEKLVITNELELVKK
jgi:hypothetical protein